MTTPPSNTVVPLRFTIEVHRYSEPRNTYRFQVWIEPSDLDIRTDMPIVHLFGHRYRQVARDQVDEGRAKGIRDGLVKSGYQRLSYDQIPLEMMKLVWLFCPIEFHQHLRDSDPEITTRVCVWVLPA